MSPTDLELKTIYDEAFDKAWDDARKNLTGIPPASHAACRAVYEQGFQDGIKWAATMHGNWWASISTALNAREEITP